MHDVFFWSALVGCTLLAVQVLLQIIGLGGAHDVDTAHLDTDVHTDMDHAGDPAHGTDGNLFFGILSFKALVAFAGIFGLTGLSLEESNLGSAQHISLAILAGVVAMVVVAYMMRMLHRLSSSGTVVIQNALGHHGQVYLRIPGNNEGHGKVTLELQGRSIELSAVTDGEAIPTGKQVKVVEVLGNETLKVISA
jgi:membrane protein implicated in regulation of membrane protease activity